MLVLIGFYYRTTGTYRMGIHPQEAFGATRTNF